MIESEDDRYRYGSSALNPLRRGSSQSTKRPEKVVRNTFLSQIKESRYDLECKLVPVGQIVAMIHADDRMLRLFSQVFDLSS
jgi:hypothetical protein